MYTGVSLQNYEQFHQLNCMQDYCLPHARTPNYVSTEHFLHGFVPNYLRCSTSIKSTIESLFLLPYDWFPF